MKITKLVHSCLLVEDGETSALFDPGIFSRTAIEQANLSQLDMIVITHRHPDHMDIETIQHLVNKFPDVKMIAPPDAREELEDAGILMGESGDMEDVVIFDAPHEDISPAGETPESQGVHFLSKLTHPGDSHHFTETKEILALPVQAPWGSMLDAIRLAIKLKPKHVIPIHDWHWNEAAREQFYHMCGQMLEQEGIIFYAPVDNQAISIDTSA